MLKALLLNHDGTGHKVAHNLTTIALVPLTAWFIYAIYALRGADFTGVQAFIAEPFNLIAAVLFAYTALKHFTLEIEVVLEDYVSNISVRHAAIIALKTFALVLGVTTIISLLKLGL